MTEEQSKRKLTPKQRLFVESYLTCWNAAAAARDAGYSKKTADQLGYQLLQNPLVQAAIQDRIKEKAMGADEVLLRLAEQARGEIAGFITIVDQPIVDAEGVPVKDAKGAIFIRRVPLFDFEAAKAAGKMHLIKKLSYTAHGPSIEFYDAQSALVHLGKHHGLFVERHELSGQLDVPVKIIEIVTPESHE